MFEIQIQNIEDNLYNGWSIYRQTFVIFHIFLMGGGRWNWKLYSIVRISLIKAMVKKNSWAHLDLTKRLLSVRNGLLVNYEQQRKSLCQETNYAVRRRRQQNVFVLVGQIHLGRMKHIRIKKTRNFLWENGWPPISNHHLSQWQFFANWDRGHEFHCLNRNRNRCFNRIRKIFIQYDIFGNVNSEMAAFCFSRVLLIIFEANAMVFTNQSTSRPLKAMGSLSTFNTRSLLQDVS